jgi:inhibitor of cysteine peptidase
MRTGIESQRHAHCSVSRNCHRGRWILVRAVIAELGIGMFTNLTAADNGKTFDMHVGDDVVMRLPENATTGYRWAVDSADENLVEVKEAEYVPPAPSAIGIGGEAHWIVHAKTAGVTQVKLKRWRHWEGESSVVERYEITLRIAA